MAGTVRFSRIVAACGQPHVHTLWAKPEQDPELQRACTAHRVMTVHAKRHQTAVGVAGFARPVQTGDQYLVFPKSLRRFEGKRVVGVKFDLIEQPELASVDLHAWKRPPSHSRKKKPAADSPARDTSTPAPRRNDAPAAKPAPTPSSRVSRRAPHRKTTPAPTITAGKAELVRAVRAAIKELKKGKTVAAYQRLERAVGE